MAQIVGMEVNYEVYDIKYEIILCNLYIEKECLMLVVVIVLANGHLRLLIGIYAC